MVYSNLIRENDGKIKVQHRRKKFKRSKDGYARCKLNIELKSDNYRLSKQLLSARDFNIYIEPIYNEPKAEALAECDRNLIREIILEELKKMQQIKHPELKQRKSILNLR